MGGAGPLEHNVNQPVAARTQDLAAGDRQFAPGKPAGTGLARVASRVFPALTEAGIGLFGHPGDFCFTLS